MGTKSDYRCYVCQNDVSAVLVIKGLNYSINLFKIERKFIMKRKAVSKKMRLKVYEKYHGHCAYCGCELEYKDMQVDHIQSVYAHDGSDDINNLMPACRMCNFYKSTFNIEDFRLRIQSINERLSKLFIYRLAIKYGLVEETQK